jgi:hypothetical protein
MDVEDDTYFKIPEGSLIVFDVDGMILEEEWNAKLINKYI